MKLTLTEPKPFREAMQLRAVKTILPTELRTKELDLIEPALRERSMFSAGVTHVEFLQLADDGVGKVLAGTSDRATQRTTLKRLIGSLGDESVDDTDVTDLRSDARLNLILDTNLQQAQGYGRWKQGQDPAVLEQWPAQELVRVRDSKEPRDWAKIWADAGGTFYGGRMIALKNDPIWTRISRFGTPYAPFDFGSGMDLDDIDRDFAIEIGLLKPDDQIDPEDRGFNADLQASPAIRSERLIDGLESALQGIAKFDASGVLRFVGGVL